MKSTAALACLASGAVAVPRQVARQSPEDITDQYMFELTLSEFSSRHAAKDPSTLIWETDGCTSSPDNPFGFKFLPGCHRHDFGYHNFREQSRFTESAKLSIDDQFKEDLYYQCESESVQAVCNGLADVYYAFVRAFGGDDATPGKRDEDLVSIYEEKVVIYNDLVKQAQDEGLLPATVQ